MVWTWFIYIYCFSTICLTIDSVAIVNRRREYNITATYASNSTAFVLLNNQIPGPLIEAELDDILVVRITNMLTTPNQGLTIHFHGMHFRGSPQMDGVPLFTQRAIKEGETFTYVFRADPAGTYFYHSHAGLQAVTAFGPLVVHDRRKPWNATELPQGPLLFSDFWANSNPVSQEMNLLASPTVYIGDPSYLLINGKRDFVLNVEPDTTYILRIIGATTLATVVFGIEDHPLTVVEVDGTLIEPKANIASIDLSPGQRYAVMFQTKKKVDRVYLMQISIRWDPLVNGSNCTGVVRYSTISQVPTDLSSLPAPQLATDTELRAFAFSNPYQTLLSSEQMPTRTADKEFFILNTQNFASDGRIRWYTNNGTFDEPSLGNITESLLFSLYNGNAQNIPQNLTYTLGQNQIIDFVFQNTVILFGECIIHPFHIHGHKFWVHSQGSGLYNATQHQTPDSAKPVYRDTVTLYPSAYEYFSQTLDPADHLKPCGWVKIRFISDNPGLWIFHCHIGAHMITGMLIVLKEDADHIVMNSMSKN